MVAECIIFLMKEFTMCLNTNAKNYIKNVGISNDKYF